jgi:galactokinase
VVDLQARLLAGFETAFAGSPEYVTHAPGRVNLIGEHTDYNDGFVLPMAISCGTSVAVRARPDRRVRIVALDLAGAESAFSIDMPIQPDQAAPWSNYVRGVVQALMDDGLNLVGTDIVVAGNVPKGAGLSSSASLEVSVGLALATLAGRPDYDRTRLALAGQRAEHEFAGCQCGIMDQLVSARAEAEAALLIDCRSLVTESVSLPKDLAVMIVHSGIERGLVDGEYNLRRAQCAAAAAHYAVPALRDLGMERLVQDSAGLDPVAFARARHVVSENARTVLAVEALRNADLPTLGQLMAESHASMRGDFEITTPAIDALVSLLQAAIGPSGGARMTGGGFGGAVVALMPVDQVDAVRAAVELGYRTQEGALPLIMIERAARGAHLVSN